MAKKQLDSLVATGQLKAEPPSAPELDGLIRSAEVRLRDAARTDRADQV